MRPKFHGKTKKTFHHWHYDRLAQTMNSEEYKHIGNTILRAISQMRSQRCEGWRLSLEFILTFLSLVWVFEYRARNQTKGRHKVREAEEWPNNNQKRHLAHRDWIPYMIIPLAARDVPPVPTPPVRAPLPTPVLTPPHLRAPVVASPPPPTVQAVRAATPVSTPPHEGKNNWNFDRRWVDAGRQLLFDSYGLLDISSCGPSAFGPGWNFFSGSLSMMIFFEIWMVSAEIERDKKGHGRKSFHCTLLCNWRMEDGTEQSFSPAVCPVLYREQNDWQHRRENV